jgi:hypothetical protein
MPIKRTASLLCLLITANVFAQKDRIVLNLCVPSLIDFIGFPTVQGGIEYKFSPKISWYNEVGIECYSFPDKADTAFLGSHGYKLKSEIRYFKNWNKSYSSLEGYYFGANFFLQRIPITRPSCISRVRIHHGY